MTEDVFFASISELNSGLTKREYSTVELVRAFSQRLEQQGPRFNALALPLTEIALRRAREVDAELKRERFRGPLQGVPFGAKDLLSVAGQITTWGAKPFAAQVTSETATVLQKLDKTGSVLIGKLAMVELAGGPSYRLASASMFGPGLNPWDRTRWSGGSSSGSGSAVAAGLVTFA
ncbi:MAG: amidase family protein, partial [Acidobacteriota bacterium]|nr:amidase family protein [Acidobacteriota bacterium]